MTGPGEMPEDEFPDEQDEFPDEELARRWGMYQTRYDVDRAHGVAQTFWALIRPRTI